MAKASSYGRVGLLLREWRGRRRLTQLELALDAGVSARHLSFVETGRSKPGREMLLAVAEQLQIPFRERNQLLLAAGHAPAFPERSLGDPELAPVRKALDRILAAPALPRGRIRSCMEPRRDQRPNGRAGRDGRELTLRCLSRRSTSCGPACTHAGLRR